jgi:hypothetical protein
MKYHKALKSSNNEFYICGITNDTPYYGPQSWAHLSLTEQECMCVSAVVHELIL